MRAGISIVTLVATLFCGRAYSDNILLPPKRSDAFPSMYPKQPTSIIPIPPKRSDVFPKGVPAKKEAAPSGNADPELEKYCLNVTAPATGMSYKFFDPKWRAAEWEAAKAALLTSCKVWTNAKQDTKRIVDLTKARNAYAKASTQLQDKLLAATIERLGPARNQQDTKLCFANASADVATYLSGTRISAFSTMVRGFYRYTQELGNEAYTFEDAIDLFNSGLSNRLVIAALTDGPLCGDDQSRDTLTYSGSDLRALWRDYALLRGQNFKQGAGTTLTMPQLNIGLLLHRASPSLNTHDFFRGLDPTRDLRSALADWLNRQCKINIPRMQSVHAEKPVSAVLDVALSSGALAMLNYNPGLISLTSGGHSNTVPANVTIDGKSYYLLRNTWGASCSGYIPEVKKRCKLGHIWVTKKEIDVMGRFVDFLGSFIRPSTNSPPWLKK